MTTEGKAAEKSIHFSPLSTRFFSKYRDIRKPAGKRFILIHMQKIHRDLFPKNSVRNTENKKGCTLFHFSYGSEGEDISWSFRVTLLLGKFLYRTS